MRINYFLLPDGAKHLPEEISGIAGPEALATKGYILAGTVNPFARQGTSGSPAGRWCITVTRADGICYHVGGRF